MDSLRGRPAATRRHRRARGGPQGLHPVRVSKQEPQGHGRRVHEGSDRRTRDAVPKVKPMATSKTHKSHRASPVVPDVEGAQPFGHVTPLRVALYARVSTAQQQTIPLQLEQLREYAK